MSIAPEILCRAFLVTLKLAQSWGLLDFFALLYSFVSSDKGDGEKM